MKAESRGRLRRQLYVLGALMCALLMLALAWSFTPLHDWLDVDRLVSGLRRLGQRFGPAAAIGCFAFACIIAVPLTFLTLVSIVAFGPSAGAAYALLGATLASVVSYGAGRALGREAVRHLAGERINDISARLARRGILAAIAMRLVPLAPFAILNMIAGSTHIRLRDFLIGSTLGMLPSTLLMALFVDRLLAAVRSPGPGSMVLVVLILVLIAGGAWFARRWAGKGP